MKRKHVKLAWEGYQLYLENLMVGRIQFDVTEGFTGYVNGPLGSKHRTAAEAGKMVEREVYRLLGVRGS